LADQNDPIGERIGLIQVMRGEQDGTTGRRQLPHRAPERVPGLDVHRDRRFVEDENVRVGNERHREAHPLRLAPRQLLRPAVRDVVDARPLEDIVHRHGFRVERCEHLDQLAHGEPLDQRSGLQHGADRT
jgi:hypothetical protein